ncbi:AI-2E family transporter [Candidatus Saccharibacteria bacterium]|nr:AI-2E family transporter [Candidatus Saccharibacteria bacterium]
MVSAGNHNHGSEMPEWLPRATFTVIGSVLAVYAGFLLMRTLKDLIAWLVIALFLSFALEPLTNRLEKRGWKRGYATGVILVASLLIFGVFVGSMVPLIVAQVKELIQDAPHFINQISSFLYDKFRITISTNDLLNKISDLGASFGVSGGNVATNVLGLGGRVVGGIFQTLTIALFTFYLVVDGPKVRRKVMALMPPKQQKIFLETWEVAIEKMGGYLYVRLILAGLTTLSAFIVMSIVRVPFALPLALWMGLIAQFIPVVGTYIAAAVPLLVALLENPWSALIVLIYVIIYQQIENYFISPKLTAKTMQLHPAIAITAAIAGGTIYGAVGAFLALPAAAILQVVGSTYTRRHEVIDDDAGLLSKPKAKK